MKTLADIPVGGDCVVKKLNGEGAVENWDKMCKDMTKKIDKEIGKYNEQQ